MFELEGDVAVTWSIPSPLLIGVFQITQGLGSEPVFGNRTSVSEKVAAFNAHHGQCMG